MPAPAVRDRLRRVTSRQNALVKELRRAFARGELTDEGDCAVEGVRILEEAVRSGARFRAVFFRESDAQRAARLLPQIAAQAEALLLPDPVFDSAVASEHPQGVAALVKLRGHTLEEVLAASEPLVVVCAGLQDPGNLGTIVRSAEAFGAAGVLLAEHTVGPFNPKVVRASAGSLFRVPVLAAKSPDILDALRRRGLRLLATSSHKGTPLPEARLSGGVAVFIGGEASGLPRQLAGAVDEWVIIPHSPRVESLNAGVAASILLYEAARQRSDSPPRYPDSDQAGHL